MSRTPDALAALAILLSACVAGQSSPSVESAQTTSAPPTLIPNEPTMTFNPGDLGAPGPAPQVTVRDSETVDGVRTEDISFSTTDVPPTDAYVVAPAHAGTQLAPAILWFHWLESGAPTSNRTEFLSEARELASRGAVSLLVQGTFPWKDRPISLDHDLAAVEGEVRMLRVALDLLVARSGVDVKRIAIVGHDFGAMYASVLFGADPRVSALVIMAPTARWGDWFLRYWSIGDPQAAYLAAMSPLDPVTWLRHADGRSVLLQFADYDRYVSTDVAEEIRGAAGNSGETKNYDTGHQLDAAARADRDAWLVKRLGLD